MTDNIPPEMKAEKRWCVWRYVDRDGRATKVPFQTSGQGAKSNDSSTWVDYETAVAAVEDRYDGVGFFLGDGWTGIDLDNCVDDGEFEPWGRDIVDKIDSYWETSPSGKGAKCFVKGPLPSGGNKRKVSETGGIEMYGEGRYFTVTGRHLRGTPKVVKPQTDAIHRVHREYIVGDILTLSVDVKEECKQHLLKSLPDSISGAFGHDKLIRAACEIRRWGFETDDALELLHYFNDHKCYPPWDHRELERKWREACDKLEPDLTVHATGPRNPKAEMPFDLGLITDVQLATEECEFEWLVEDAIVAGQHGIIGGPDKSMKTSLIVDLAISLTSGTPFLGYFNVPEPSPTVIVSGESGRPALRHLAENVREARGAAPSETLHWGFTLPNLGLESHLDALRAAIEMHGIKFMVIDPAYLSMNLGDDAKNMFRMGPLLNSYSLIGSQMGCTMFLCHHLVKGIKKNSTPALRDLSMSGFSSWTRQWILVNPAGEFESLTGGLNINMVIGGSAGFGGRYTVKVDQGSKADGPGYTAWETDVSAKEGDALAEEPEPEKVEGPEMPERAALLMEGVGTLSEWTVRQVSPAERNYKRHGDDDAARWLVDNGWWVSKGVIRNAETFVPGEKLMLS